MGVCTFTRWWLVIVIAVSSCVATARRIEANEPIPSEITSELKAWEDSWLTLRFTYRDETVGNTVRYWVTKDGKLRREMEFDGQKVRDVHANTPKTGVSFKAKYENGNLLRVEISNYSSQGKVRSGNEFSGALGVFPVAPYWEAPRNDWLGSVLARGIGQLKMIEENDGIVQARIQVGAEHEMLLSERYNFQPILWKKQIGTSNEAWEWNATEFKEAQPGIWFPIKGTAGMQSTGDLHQWTVTEVVMNERFDEAVFAPPRSEAQTRVIDLSGRYGSRSPNRRTEMEIAQEAKKNVDAEDRVTASLNSWRSYSWSIVLLIVALALLGIVVFRNLQTT